MWANFIWAETQLEVGGNVTHTSVLGLPWCYSAELQWEKKMLLIVLENYGVKISVTKVEIYCVLNISAPFFCFFPEGTHTHKYSPFVFKKTLKFIYLGRSFQCILKFVNIALTFLKEIYLSFLHTYIFSWFTSICSISEIWEYFLVKSLVLSRFLAGTARSLSWVMPVEPCPEEFCDL